MSKRSQLLEILAQSAWDLRPYLLHIAANPDAPALVREESRFAAKLADKLMYDKMRGGEK